MVTSTSEPALSPVILRAEEGSTLTAFGDVVQFKLSGEQTGGGLALGMCLTPPGGGPPPHLHRQEDELFLITEGTVSFLANGTWTDVGPGGAVFVPRGAVHTFKNNTAQVTKHWVIATPSGFERFFGRCAQVFAAGGAAGPDMTQIMQICGEHGIEFAEPA